MTTTAPLSPARSPTAPPRSVDGSGRAARRLVALVPFPLASALSEGRYGDLAALRAVSPTVRAAVATATTGR